MTGGGIERRGPKDSENAHNSFLTKCTEKGFWRFATAMAITRVKAFEELRKFEYVFFQLQTKSGL